LNTIKKIDGGYWQTVIVCQLKVIGRPLRSANKRLLADRSQKYAYGLLPFGRPLIQKSNYCCTVQKIAATRDCLSLANSFFFPMYQVFSLKAGGQRVILRVGCNAHLSQVINAVITPVVLKETVYFR